MIPTDSWHSVKEEYFVLRVGPICALSPAKQQARLRVKGQHVLLVHGSPASIEEGLDAETPKARLRELAALVKDDLVLCAHSHRPFVRRAKGVWLINPGSVGRPDDGDPRASYAILSFKRTSSRRGIGQLPMTSSGPRARSASRDCRRSSRRWCCRVAIWMK